MGANSKAASSRVSGNIWHHRLWESMQSGERYIFVMISGLADMGAEALGRDTKGCAFVGDALRAVTVFARFKKLKLQQTWNNIHLAKDPTRPSSSKYDSGGGEMIEALFLLKN
ncbi:hypothetical protein MCOR27_011023 [Pyricularia oryzae]|uniref:Uncharacterized protein n=4 Tax=Pyricularia TaxID=48558 RepID=A0ABQ8NG61_PYRGI|nr:uncharacterized protein MGG_15742 [Pyricularia oryzae 70-15]ELQ43256.1 hypothetical protein OOU_Y34scaffold00162g25 [Pyricularia oryzae Y34]KAI6266438.1 hypothetical protein MCOR27_011023 [Pyricularia oryzae]KAI6296532.1 hypothetical protein MCOR33_006881 [Pyricularia grisea]EHA54797.1 hypothetical protein MGG_15742 [Pyricularia oryzae 70-15]KAI6287164.1 hypothetical protein MCOR26_000713 [Pyricularia oryzae]